ncbi:MAG: DUF3501 family protein [Chromatiales bacterium]|jgi:hypothetical protein
MNKLSRQDLFSLESYAEKRKDFRANVLEHKKNRALAIGPNATLYFEDRLTMQYQIQEMLRIEKIFEADGIQEELDAYNPLIPDGSNWKATFMMEYADVEERRVELAKLMGIEDKTWVQVDGFERVYAIADEDLDRTEADKTSAVHFLRFELSDAMTSAVKQGVAINAGIDHENYNYEVCPIADNIRASLMQDLH